MGNSSFDMYGGRSPRRDSYSNRSYSGRGYNSPGRGYNGGRGSPMNNRNGNYYPGFGTNNRGAPGPGGYQGGGPTNSAKGNGADPYDTVNKSYRDLNSSPKND